MEHRELLDSLKGVLLLSERGDIFVLSEYTTHIVKYKKGFWVPKVVEVERLASVTYHLPRLGVVRTTSIEKHDTILEERTIKALVDSRQRYLTLTKGLYKFGYVIKKK